MRRPPLPATPTDDPPRLLTLDEACERFRLSRRYLSAAVAAGRLPAARFGRSVRLDVHDLRAFVAAAKTPRAS